MTTAAFLVPRRADHGHRDKVWEFTRERWRKTLPDIPIVEGHDDGPGKFNRSLAMNNAREAAPAADVYIILDADVTADPVQVTNMIKTAVLRDRMTIGYLRWASLTEEGTHAVMAGYTKSWNPLIDVAYMRSVSSLVAVPSWLWDRVGGFDERFCGWGLEDSAFTLACSMFAGPYRRIGGTCWHLWHPANHAERNTEREGNRRFFEEYLGAQDQQAMLRVVNSRRSA